MMRMRIINLSKMLIEVFSDPSGKYLGAIVANLERMPFKRFCGLFYWRFCIWQLDEVGGDEKAED